MAKLAAECGTSPILARLLLNRGITSPEAVDSFVRARLAEHLRSPMLFRDMSRASERLLAAIRTGERIGIYGDYDVDGISGSALLIRFFRALAVEPLLYIPNRVREGYGLNAAGIRSLVEGGARVLVTVDCGGMSYREIELARSLGVDVIVCDHHQVSDTPLAAHAVLNPIEPDAGFPFRGLCGTGVAFYLALGVRMRLRDESGAAVPDVRRYLDLVALGTIADMVPIVEENRVLVKYGLRELQSSEHPGLKALKQVSGVGDVSSGTVGFRLAPRLNAGGRLADATRAVRLLTTDDAGVACELAAYLDDENRIRQSIERQIFDDAVARVEAAGPLTSRHSIVLASSEWHPGVIGIVASRLVEKFYRPTILIGAGTIEGTGRGSGRSIRTVNLYAAIKKCSELLLGFGGHPMAAGLTIAFDRVEEFASRFEAAIASCTRAEDFVPETNVDAELSFTEINEGLLRDVEMLEPYGISNAEPVFLTRGVRVRSARAVGESHLKLFLEHAGRFQSAIGFRMGERLPEPGTSLDILWTPMVSTWGGTTSVELRLRDMRPRAA